MLISFGLREQQGALLDARGNIPHISSLSILHAH